MPPPFFFVFLNQDGIDLKWETNRGGNPDISDKINFFTITLVGRVWCLFRNLN